MTKLENFNEKKIGRELRVPTQDLDSALVQVATRLRTVKSKLKEAEGELKEAENSELKEAETKLESSTSYISPRFRHDSNLNMQLAL